LLQTCGTPEAGSQRRLLGEHSPLQLPLPEQTNWHAAWFCHDPVWLQSCGTPDMGLQRRLPGTHSPLQLPLPEHTNGHGA
jgi:hypothetical protein